MNVESRVEIIESSFDILGFSELMKPELTGLSVLTAVCAFYLGSDETIELSKLLLTALGTLFVGGAAGTLNQYLERDLDGLMKRTERRPLPAGRLSPVAALFFGVVLSFFGLSIFLTKTNTLTFFIALLTLVLYLFVYTPLKRKSPINTVVGAIPGALPVLIGWSAAQDDISLSAILLFALLFTWQIPHFLSLGWMYRKDYSRAGFKMLPVVDQEGTKTARDALWYSLALLLVSVMMTVLHVTGYYYLAGAAVAGALFLVPVFRFYRATREISLVSTATRNGLSRTIFFASLAYLPAIMLLMVFDKV